MTEYDEGVQQQVDRVLIAVSESDPATATAVEVLDSFHGNPAFSPASVQAALEELRTRGLLDARLAGWPDSDESNLEVVGFSLTREGRKRVAAMLE